MRDRWHLFPFVWLNFNFRHNCRPTRWINIIVTMKRYSGVFVCATAGLVYCRKSSSKIEFSSLGKSTFYTQYQVGPSKNWLVKIIPFSTKTIFFDYGVCQTQRMQWATFFRTSSSTLPLAWVRDSFVTDFVSGNRQFTLYKRAVSKNCNWPNVVMSVLKFM